MNASNQRPHSSTSRPAGGRRRRRLRWGLAGLVVVAAAVVVAATIPSASQQEGVAVSGRAEVGAPAPSATMVDFDGVQFSLADYAGTPLVVNFWASWCPACVAEMPDFERVHQRVNGEEVAFLGVNMQDVESLARTLLDDTGVTYRIAADPDGTIYGAFGGLAMPTTVFINAEGTVTETRAGLMTEEDLVATIEHHFGVSL